MQKENQSMRLTQASQKLKCVRHLDQIPTLICISQNCKQDRLFCLQCLDGKINDQHSLLSIKKFQQIYDKFKHIKDKTAKKQLQTTFLQFKNKINFMLNQFENILFLEYHDQVVLINGQQQQLRGKINSIASQKLWNYITKQKKQNKADTTIENNLKQIYLLESAKILSTLEIIQKKLIIQFKNSIELLTSFIKPKDVSHLFGINKHPSLQLSENKKIIRNTIDDGHFFILCDDKITQQCNRRDFKILSYGPKKDAAIWIGITYPYISHKYQYTNIYQQNKGSYFAVFHDNGVSVNLWSSAAVKPIREIKGLNLRQETIVRVTVDYLNRTCRFLVGKHEDTLKILEQIKMQFIKGKQIYPSVGLYGFGEVCYL